MKNNEGSILALISYFNLYSIRGILLKIELTLNGTKKPKIFEKLILKYYPSRTLGVLVRPLNSH